MIISGLLTIAVSVSLIIYLLTRIKDISIEDLSSKQTIITLNDAGKPSIPIAKSDSCSYAFMYSYSGTGQFTSSIPIQKIISHLDIIQTPIAFEPSENGLDIFQFTFKNPNFDGIDSASKTSLEQTFNQGVIFASFSRDGRLMNLYIDQNMLTLGSSLKPIIIGMQVLKKEDQASPEPTEITEQDVTAPVHVKYEKIGPASFRKTKMFFEVTEDLSLESKDPDIKPLILKSEISISFLEETSVKIVKSIINREEIEIPFPAPSAASSNSIKPDQVEQKTRLSSTSEYILKALMPLSETEKTLCLQRSSAFNLQALLKEKNLTSIESLLESAENSILAVKKEAVKDLSVQDLMRSLQSPSLSEKQKNETLVQLSDLLTFFPEHVESVSKEIKDKWRDQDAVSRYLSYLVGALASASGNAAESAMLGLMMHVQQEDPSSPFLERLILAEQISKETPEDTMNFFWDFFWTQYQNKNQNQNLSNASKSSLLAYGSGVMKQKPDSRLKFSSRLLILLKDDTPRSDKLTIISSIGNAGDDQAFPQLKRIAEGNDISMASAAMNAMRFMSSAEVTSYLIEFFMDDSSQQNKNNQNADKRQLKLAALHAINSKAEELSEAHIEKLTTWFSWHPKSALNNYNNEFRIEVLKILVNHANHHEGQAKIFLLQLKNDFSLSTQEKALISKMGI